MKKVLIGIIAVALVVGIGLGVKAKNQAGDPPVGKRTYIQTAQISGGMTTLGDPPVG